MNSDPKCHFALGNGAFGSKKAGMADAKGNKK
jgi:hypothetical protein